MRVAKSVTLHHDALVVIDNLGGVWYGYYQGNEVWTWHKVTLPNELTEWSEDRG